MICALACSSSVYGAIKADNSARIRLTSSRSALCCRFRRLFNSTIAFGSTNTVCPEALWSWTTPPNLFRYSWRTGITYRSFRIVTIALLKYLALLPRVNWPSCSRICVSVVAIWRRKLRNNDEASSVTNPSLSIAVNKRRPTWGNDTNSSTSWSNDRSWTSSSSKSRKKTLSWLVVRKTSPIAASSCPFKLAPISKRFKNGRILPKRGRGIPPLSRKISAPSFVWSKWCWIWACFTSGCIRNARRCPISVVVYSTSFFRILSYSSTWRAFSFTFITPIVNIVSNLVCY